MKSDEHPRHAATAAVGPLPLVQFPGGASLE